MSRTYKDLNPDTVRSQMHRIIKSDAFKASERNCRLFEYVVEETLAGRANRLKAYNIATTVFGRDSNFDPQNDPIVRIEARRVRRALELYYLTVGKNEDLVISIPKGGYSPKFRTEKAIQSDPPGDVDRMRPETKPETGVLSPPGVVIFVASFEEEGGKTEFLNFTNGFTRTLIVALTRFKDLVVYGAETEFHYGENLNLGKLRTNLAIDFLIKGGVMMSPDRLDVEVMMIEARTGRCLWAENFGIDFNSENIASARDEVANTIARTLAQPFGIIYSRNLRELENSPPEDFKLNDPTTLYYRYWQSIDPDLHAKARVALEQSITRNPHSAETLACLSHIYTDAYRFGFNSGLGEDDPLDRALELANQAISFAPYSSRGHSARALARWFLGDTQASLDSLETALKINPNDTEIMADLGMHYAMLTEWDKAVPLLEKAYLQNPALPDTFRVGLALFHLAHGRYEDSLKEARKINAKQVVYGYILEAAAAAGLGLQKQAAAALSAIKLINPDYDKHIVTDLQKRGLHPDLTEHIVELLKRTGSPEYEDSSRIIQFP